MTPNDPQQVDLHAESDIHLAPDLDREDEKAIEALDEVDSLDRDLEDDDPEIDDFDRDFDEYDHDLVKGNRHAHRRAMQRPRAEPKRDPTAMVRRLAADDDTLATGFDTLTYTPTRHEKKWLSDALGGFFVQGDITDVLRMIKGGKEASVYQVAVPPDSGMPFAAAKIYRPRAHRSLRNDARYRHGRTVLDEAGKQLHDARAWHAIITGTDMGKDLQHASWMSYEFVTLARLHKAGADVPRPIARGPNVILMEYIGDERMAATTLNHVHLEPDEAARLLERVLDNVALMLSLGIVHGDLSAYNVLYWQGKITLIDFPQVVNPVDNPDAPAIFERDVTRICQYFATQGAVKDPVATAEALWSTYVPEGLDIEQRPEFQAAKLDAEMAALEARAREEDDDEYDEEDEDEYDD